MSALAVVSELLSRLNVNLRFISKGAYQREIDNIARGANGRFSRGNVAAQHGYILTGSALDAEREDRRRRIAS